MSEEISKELVDKMKELPKWLKEPESKNEDGDYVWEVECFGETFKLKELKGSSYEAAISFADKMAWDEMKVVLQRSLVDLKASDLDELRGRQYIRLKGALAYVYGMNDF